jgi:hypothetical protein
MAENRQAQLETAGTAFWLLMDVLWMLEWTVSSAVAGALALLLHIAAFRYTPRNVADQTASAAVSCWVLMNLLWMLGDAYERPAWKDAALLVVLVSFALLAVSVWAGGLRGPILQRFRRFKLNRASN